MPTYSFGHLSFREPSSFNIFNNSKLCLLPTSKSLKSCAGVIFTAPLPISGSEYSSKTNGIVLDVSGIVKVISLKD